jgi:hypothetical protein
MKLKVERNSPNRSTIQFSTSGSASSPTFNFPPSACPSFNIQPSTFNFQLSLSIPMNESSPKTPPILVALAWIIVAIPLGWGLYQSIIKSEPLFKGASAPPAQVVPAGPGK